MSKSRRASWGRSLSFSVACRFSSNRTFHLRTSHLHWDGLETNRIDRSFPKLTMYQLLLHYCYITVLSQFHPPLSPRFKEPGRMHVFQGRRVIVSQRQFMLRLYQEPRPGLSRRLKCQECVSGSHCIPKVQTLFSLDLKSTFENVWSSDFWSWSVSRDIHGYSGFLKQKRFFQITTQSN